VEIGEIGELRIIPFQFSQLMHNLIGNALKFSKPGVTPLVKISGAPVSGAESGIAGLSPQKKYLRLTISDNGIGFSPQYKVRIFEVFQRLHGRSEYPGTGIGLAIVKKIVDNHNGVIEAWGEDGVGARFDIYIPM
jgi:signal transduction histidine kinase